MFAPVGAAVPISGRCSRTRNATPAVVCVDDRARFAIALCGGHAGGGNDLARLVASILGAEPVVTTGTDLAGLPGLDDLPGFEAVGDLAAVTRRWLDGEHPAVTVDRGLEGRTLPGGIAENALADPEDGPLPSFTGGIRVSDSVRPAQAGEVVLRPRSIVVGVGSSTGADPESLLESAHDALERAQVHPAAVDAVATIDLKASEPAIVALSIALGVRLVAIPATALAAAADELRVPTPSEVVAAAVGTPSVAEAAALLTAGPGSVLLIPKQVSRGRDSTVAISRRSGPPATWPWWGSDQGIRRCEQPKPPRQFAMRMSS